MGNRPQANSIKKKNIFYIGALVAIAGLLFGMDTGIITGALPFLEKEFGLDEKSLGHVVGALMSGGAIGAILAGWLSWKIGRKISLIISAILFFIGSVLCASALNVETLIFARVILGLGIGIASFAAPLYLAEIAPERIRGSMISFYQMLITIGILAAFLVDTGFSYYSAWRWMLGIVAIPAFLFFIGLLYLPRSPRWLVAKKRYDEAEKVLKTIRSDDEEIAQEFQNIKDSLSVKQTGWKLFKSNKNFRRSVSLGALLQIMQQLTGINIILYYAPTIIKLAGFTSTTQQMWATVAIGLINVFFTLIAISVIDRWGRRPTFIFGFLTMAVSMAFLSLMLYLQSSSLWMHYFSVFVILVFIAGFAVSAGPLVWTLCSEIQPLKGRDFGITISTAANWLSNMFLSAFFLSFLVYLGPSTTFVILALLNFSFIFLTIWFIPETKNISLEDIEKNLMQGKPLRKIGQPLS